MDKQMVINSLEDLPDNFELDELVEKLIVLAKIEKGKLEVRSNQVISHEEARNELTKWLK